MTKNLRVIVFSVLFSAGVSFGQYNSSIPVDSWIYDAVQQLQTHGYLLQLSPGFKPYRRLEVSEALSEIEKKTDVSALPQVDRWLIEKLDKEFSEETGAAGARIEKPDSSFTGLRFSEEAFLNLARGNYGAFKYAGKTEFRPTLRSEFGINIGNHLLMYTDATIDQTLRDDSLYMGSPKFGIDALHQQAYVQYSDRYLDLTFGRDYLSWGYGDDGSALVSPAAGAFDMLSVFIKTKTAKFNWFVAQLNKMPEFTPDSNNFLETGSPSTWGQIAPLADRYFTGSRIEFDINDQVFLGAYQAATFGGVNTPINLEAINPVRVVYETEINDSVEVNAFVGVDASVFWPKGVNLYGDLMIDDWQVDHKVQADLKPDLYAFDLGARLSNILGSFGVTGTDLGLQYRMVRNRVYNEYNWSSFEKLMLRNHPIANPFGDDFWNIDLRLSQWLTYDWEVGVEVMHIEHGDENVYGSYTMPWLDTTRYSIQSGYSEPFPYGIIQETNFLEASITYQPQHDFYVKAMVSYSQNRNYQYVPGTDKGVLSFLFTIYYDFTKNIPFQ